MSATSKVKSLIMAGTAMAATALGLPPIRVKPKAKRYAVEGKTGKRKQPFRHIIRHEVIGPQFIQTGIRWIHGEAQPIMKRVVTHRFYHATKGWRTYHDRVPDVARARSAA